MPSRKDIEEQNAYLLRQQRNFRVAADHLARGPGRTSGC